MMLVFDIDLEPRRDTGQVDAERAAHPAKCAVEGPACPVPLTVGIEHGRFVAIDADAFQKLAAGGTHGAETGSKLRAAIELTDLAG